MTAQHATLDLIRQIRSLLVQIDPVQYRLALPEFNGSTLGQHFRHALEFFQCLEKGSEAGLVDYAARERNLMYEDNPVFTAEAFDVFAASLHALNLQAPINVRAEFGSDERPEFPSTLGRELLFAYDHAIHHLAIIKIGLHCHFPEISMDKDLGVSPSTLKARAMKSN
jgi:hypothetical protein